MVIWAICCLIVIGLGIFAIISGLPTWICVAAILISLVPLFYLYNAIVLERRQKESTHTKTHKRQYKKAVGGQGKVLNFPEGGRKEHHK